MSVSFASLQWGRGVIQTTGVCNFGKLNYFLGARAAREGRPSRYPNIDFCLDPEVRVMHHLFELNYLDSFAFAELNSHLISPNLIFRQSVHPKNIKS